MANQEKQKKKKLSFRAKYILYSILKFTLLFLPLIIVILINFKDYFYHYDGWKVALGFIIGSICVILVILKEATFLKGTWGIGIVFIVSYLLKPIINDIVLISGAMFLGKLFANLVNYKVVRYKRLMEKKEEADISAEAYQEKMRELEEEKLALTSQADWRV
jgi:hypothetical protein